MRNSVGEASGVRRSSQKERRVIHYVQPFFGELIYVYSRYADRHFLVLHDWTNAVGIVVPALLAHLFPALRALTFRSLCFFGWA